MVRLCSLVAIKNNMYLHKSRNKKNWEKKRELILDEMWMKQIYIAKHTRQKINKTNLIELPSDTQDNRKKIITCMLNSSYFTCSTKKIKPTVAQWPRNIIQRHIHIILKKIYQKLSSSPMTRQKKLFVRYTNLKNSFLLTKSSFL